MIYSNVGGRTLHSSFGYFPCENGCRVYKLTSVSWPSSFYRIFTTNQCIFHAFDMASFTYYVFLCLQFFMLMAGYTESKVCHKIDQCSCVFDSGDEINLHLSSASEDGKPLFKFLSSPGATSYTYSPCAGLNCGHLPGSDAAICMKPPLSDDSPIGNVSSAVFTVVESNVTLLYQWNGMFVREMCVPCNLIFVYQCFIFIAVTKRI